MNRTGRYAIGSWFQAPAAALALAGIVAVIGGCASPGPGGADVHGSVYVGAGYYDPWYWGPGYVPPPAVIGPPPGRPDRPVERPPQPTHPIATPPSRPTPAPRPAARPRGGGGRR